MRTRSIVHAAALVVAGAAGPLSAQATEATPQDQLEAATLAAYNQLGLLEYCQGEGYVSADVVALQSKMMALLPAPQDSSSAAQAQETGREGTIASGGQTMDIADASAGEGTAETVCKEIGDAVTTTAAGLPAD